jgi:hypothetical protein
MDDTDDNGYSGYGQGAVWVLIVVIFVILRLVMRIAAPAPPFVRVQPVPSRGGLERAVVKRINGRADRRRWRGFSDTRFAYG